VYYYLADSYVKVKQDAAAQPLLEKLLQEFDKSQYVPEAQKLLATLKAQAQTK
jgi:hypothetical protein